MPHTKRPNIVKGDVMPKEPNIDFEDFVVAIRESYEKGHSDPQLVKKVIEMAKYLSITLSIKPSKE